MDKNAQRKTDDEHLPKKKAKTRHHTSDSQTTMFNYKEKLQEKESRLETKQNGEKKGSKKDGSKFSICPSCNRQVITAQLAHHIDSKCEQYNHSLTLNGNIEISENGVVVVKPPRGQNQSPPPIIEEKIETNDSVQLPQVNPEEYHSMTEWLHPKKRKTSENSPRDSDQENQPPSENDPPISADAPAVVITPVPLKEKKQVVDITKSPKKSVNSPKRGKSSKNQTTTKSNFFGKPKTVSSETKADKSPVIPANDEETPSIAVSTKAVNPSPKSSKKKSKSKPLADRMRPRNLEEVIGQEESLGDNGIIKNFFSEDKNFLPSLIFWGPPGTGKTTLARLLAQKANHHFIQLSAVEAGVSNIKETEEIARNQRMHFNKKTILFLDEIHRFNKAQQDRLLPLVEDGSIILIGATTENPSFEVNSALLSRCRVIVLKKLEQENIEVILNKAIQDDERGYGNTPMSLKDNVIPKIAQTADGDARAALNLLEICIEISPTIDGIKTVSLEILNQALQRNSVSYDKKGEEHYNTISALHKSMRGSDVDASLYWMARMLEGGEDPLYIARRLIRFASEDIGLADSNALTLAVACFQACHVVGTPECNVTLAQCVAYLARAPKSNSLYVAYKEIQKVIQEQPNAPVPLHIRNAPTKLMKDIGYSKGYIYNPDHDVPVHQNYLPDVLQGRKFFNFKVHFDPLSEKQEINSSDSLQ